MNKKKNRFINDIWVAVLDIIAVNGAYLLALVIRYYVNNEFNPGSLPFINVLYHFAPWYTLICLVVFYLFRLYGGLWRYAGISDMNRILGANAVTCAVHVIGTLWLYQRMPTSYYIGGAALQLIFIMIIRFAYRIFVIEKRRTRKAIGPAMIVGTGETGEQMMRLLDTGLSYNSACFIDIGNNSNGQSINGIPIYDLDKIEEALERHSIKCVFLADLEISDNDREKIKAICKYKGIDFKDYSSFFTFVGESDSFTGMQAVVQGPEGQRRIPFSPPDISDSEIAEVTDALKSGWITTGPRTKLLERRLAAYIETGKTDYDTESEQQRWSNRVVCLNSATAAEELNLRVLGVKEGDEVIVPAYTYTASASAAIHCGAKVIFVDIQKDGDPVTHMPEMDYDALEAAITPKTKAIVTVDLGGIVCDYDRVFEIVKRKRDLFVPLESDGTKLGDLSARIQHSIGRVAVVADCAHSLGASRVFSGVRRYCGAIADFTSFSFHAVKNFTTAEGGASTWLPIDGVDNADIYKMYQLLSLHGQNKDALAKTKLGAWEYDIIGPRYKCNMTDIMAAIGLRQLDRYQGLLDRRVEIIKKYDAVCDELGISHLLHHTDGMDSSNHLYLIRIPGIDVEQRNELIEKLAEHGVATNVHYKPMPMMTAYKALGWDVKDFPNTYDYYHNLITLPLHTLLTDEDVEYVCECYKEVYNTLKQK